jgi:hypothetical protein
VAIVNPVTINANIEKRFIFGNNNKKTQGTLKTYTQEIIKNINLNTININLNIILS